MDNGGRGYRSRPSFLYAIEGGGLVKLGRSVEPQKRLRSLQRMSPTPLTLIATIPEHLVSEEEAHERWSEQRAHGEWFEPSPELRAWIEWIGRRGRLAIDLYERATERYSRAPHHRRPLSRLRAAEEVVEQRQAAREEARQRANGCRLCGDRDAKLQRPSVDPKRLYCGSCGSWLRRVKAEGLAAVEEGYRRAANEATERLEAHRARAAAYEAGVVLL